MRSLIFVLLNAIFVSSTQAQYQPISAEYVTGQTGLTAILFCNTNLTMETDHNTVATWIRRRDLQILTIGQFTYTDDERFMAHEMSLRIRFVQPGDQGIYECQTSRGKGKETHLVHLIVITPRAVIPGKGQYHVAQGSTLTLDCIIEKSARDDIFWSHNDRMINYDTKRTTVTTERRPSSIRSQLTVADTSLSDTGNYTCHPTTAEPVSVVVYVTKAPTPLPLTPATEGGESPSSTPAPFSPWELSLILTLLLGQQ